MAQAAVAHPVREGLVIHNSNPIGITDKRVLYNKKISLSSKAVHTIIMNMFNGSLNEDHEISPEEIAKYTEESVDFVFKCLTELEHAGYLG